MSEESKALVGRFVEEAFNRGNLDVADEVYATSFVSHERAGPVERSPEYVKGFEEEWNIFDQPGLLRQLGVAPG